MLSFKDKLRLAEGNPATTQYEKDWQSYMKNKMDDEGIDSMDDLSQEEKSKFFTKVDEGWNSKSEKGTDGPTSAMAKVLARYNQ